LRTIPDKLIGVLYLVLSLLVIFIIPLFDYGVIQSPNHRHFFKLWFWSFIWDLVVISWLGSQPLENPLTEYSPWCVLNFFMDVFVLLPFINMIDNKIGAQEKKKKIYI